MKNHYTKPYGYGAMSPKNVANIVKQCSVEIQPGHWIPARPLPYYSLIERLRQAWDILTYKADALYWGE